MKKLLILAALVFSAICLKAQNAKTEKADSVFIAIDYSPFARCFAIVDTNKDGIVTFAEANVADTLYLGYGGRKNIISNVDFLKHFPNLKYLNPGNATVEELDLRHMKKLEVLDLTLAPFVKKITITTGCCPKIIYPHGEGEFVVNRVYDPNDQSSWWH
ncbi:MAG: hypothetical protein IJK39_07020 [Bacteroidales bacterium]|nr:hypothetical protein [Bacteroidales bacterium]